MSRAATHFKSILLGGVVAVAAAFLLLALLSPVPGPATEAGPLAAPSITFDQSPSSPAPRAGEPSVLTSCRQAPPPAGALLPRSHSADRSVDSRHTEFGATLVHGSGIAAGEFPTGLARFRGRFPAATPCPVYVLFCTWLA
jgi:hypothetical protein